MTKTIRLLLSGMLACALHTMPALSQTRVSGTVTDDTGRPMLGAQVVETENLTNGTIADADGRFSLTVSDPNTALSVSFMGYITVSVPLSGQSQITVQLTEDVLQLDELVVVGYGTQRKSDLTGAVARADLEALQNSPAVSLSQMLKGTVPGLNIGASSAAGASPSMQIRGQNSLSGSGSPLIVLDGIIYRGELVDINPSDIASIDVLKDASSAAIYGSQATNGIIFITTKTETRVTKPVIEYSANLSIQSSINPKMKSLDREGYLQMVADSFLADSRIDYGEPNPKWDPTQKFIEPEVAAGYAAGTDTDWYGLTTIDMPYVQNHNISVRGRGESVNYFASFGLTDQKNLIRNDDFKRYSFRVNLETQVAKWLKVGTQSFFSISDTSGQTASFADISMIQPLVAAFNEDGSLIEKPARGLTNFLLLLDNPDLNRRYNLNGTFYGEIAVPFVEGLSYRVNYSTAMNFTKRFRYDPYANNNLGSGYKNNALGTSWTLDNILTYKRAFGADNQHDINATAVYGVEYRDSENTDASGAYSDERLGYDGLGTGQADQFRVGTGAWKETSLYMMARVAYSYRGKYSLTGTVRRDGFSGFGSRNKFAVFGSVGAAWRVSEEPFFRNAVDWVDNLKARASYGSNGNRAVGRYATVARMGNGNGYLYGDGATGERTQWVSEMSNPNLRWESTASLNAGLDFSLFNGRLWGAYDYYHSTTSDLLYSITIPYANGFTNDRNSWYSVLTNLGEIQNQGHELALGGSPIRKRDFSWDVNFNFSRNRSRINTIRGIDADGDGREDDLSSANPPLFIGQPMGMIYNYRITGIYQLDDLRNGTISANRLGTYKVQDVNGDNKIDADNDRVLLGNTNPSYRFSIQNRFQYKNWELNIFINSVQGGKDWYLANPLSNFSEGKQWNFFEFDYWTPENPGAKYRQPGAWNESYGATFHPYISRSFIRLQELSLGYSLPRSLLRKVNIARARVFVTANNLLTITKWDGWDPEAGQGISYNLGTTSTGFGNRNNYPTMKSFSVGLNLEF